MLTTSKFSHLKSITHKIFDESFIRRYIVQNPSINDFDKIMGRYIIIFTKKDETNLVSCLLKLLITTNRVRYIRINTKLNLDFFKISLKIRHCLELIKNYIHLFSCI